VSRARPRATGSPWFAAALGLAIALGIVLPGCIVQRLTGPQLTGTCDGACAHYTQCKAGHGNADRQRCVAECPGVFSDRDSLMAYESLSCEDAVEYVDGNAAKTAARHH
jgi:hypothetical protein